MPAFQIPKRVSLEDLKSILKGYYVEGAHNEPVSTKSVEDTTQLSDRVGRQTPFLEEVGLLEKKGRKRALTDVGAEIAEALMGGGEAMAKSVMRDLLVDWDFTSKVTGFVRMQGPVEQKQLFEYITANTAANDSRGKETLVELLLWTDILKETEEGIYEVSDAKPTAEDEENVDDGEIEDEGSDDTNTNVVPDSGKRSLSTPSNISIELQFTTADDPDDVLKTIAAARRALEMPSSGLEGILTEDDSDE